MKLGIKQGQAIIKGTFLSSGIRQLFVKLDLSMSTVGECVPENCVRFVHFMNGTFFGLSPKSEAMIQNT